MQIIFRFAVVKSAKFNTMKDVFPGFILLMFLIVETYDSFEVKKIVHFSKWFWEHAWHTRKVNTISKPISGMTNWPMKDPDGRNEWW